MGKPKTPKNQTDDEKKKAKEKAEAEKRNEEIKRDSMRGNTSTIYRE